MNVLSHHTSWAITGTTGKVSTDTEHQTCLNFNGKMTDSLVGEKNKCFSLRLHQIIKTAIKTKFSEIFLTFTCII